MSLRDAVVSIFYDLTGQEQIRQADEEIDQTARDAKDMGDEAEKAGKDMEEAGERGERSFNDTSASVINLEENIGEVAAASTAAFAGFTAASATAVTQAGNLEQAMVRVDAMSGGAGETLRKRAEQVEESTNSLVSAQQALQGQGMLLRSGVMDPKTVGNLSTAISNLAVTTGEDYMEVVEELRDPLFEAEGATQLVTKGFISSQKAMLQNVGAWQKGIRNLRELKEAQGEQAARQALINQIMLESQNRTSAAGEIQKTFNNRLTGAVNAASAFAAAIGRDLIKGLSKNLAVLTEWFRSLEENNPEMLAFTGRLLGLGTILTGLTTVITGAAAAVAYFGTAALVTAATTVGIATAMSFFLIPIIDLISVLITGRSLIVDWGNLWKWLGDTIGVTADTLQAVSAVAATIAAVFYAPAVAIAAVGAAAADLIYYLTTGESVLIGWGEMFQFIERNAKAALSWLKNFGSWLVDIGLDAGAGLMSGLWKGIKKGAGKVTDTVSGVVEEVRSYLPFSPAAQGPLSDLDKTGQGFNETIAMSMQKSQSVVKKSAEKTAQTVKKNYSKDVQTLESSQSSSQSLMEKKIVLDIPKFGSSQVGTENARRLAEQLAPILRRIFGDELDVAFG